MTAAATSSPPRARGSADLSTGWTLRCLGGPGAPGPVLEAVLPADAPCGVHAALLAAGLIDHPYRDRGWERCRWIGRCGWSFTRGFENPGTPGPLELVLAGVDGPATALLNGERLGRCENGFRPHVFPLGERLREQNELEVRFDPPATAAEKAAAGPYPIAMPGITPYNGLRKVACGFGWDWAPPMEPCGLSGGIRVRRADAPRIDAIAVTTESADRRQNAAVSITVRGANAAGGRVRLRLSGAEDCVVAETSSMTDEAGVASAVLHVEGARWWQPRGLGEQPLYELRCSIGGAEATRRIGLRAVEIDRTPDDPEKPEAGTAFALRVNGQRVFARGFNWIPDDTLLDRVDPATTQARLDDALASGANTIRVWGGGVAESDAFYDRCDEEGLLVWQDFAFACAMYDEAKLRREVAEEAAYLTDRLAARPSLAVWCGGNECLWFHRLQPGWAEAVGETGWGEGFYGELLPDAVAEHSPGTAYVANSPGGRTLRSAADDENHGPQHPWDAWNREPAEAYLRGRPRFAAEFGFCGAAHAETLRWALPGVAEADRPEAVWDHLMATRGRAKLEARLDEVFGAAAVNAGLDLDAWVFATQLMQARAVDLGVSWYRSLQPRNAGALVWQLQDSWPAVSWSVIDWFGRRKLAWYGARRAMAPEAGALLAPDNDPERLQWVRMSAAGVEPQPVLLRAVSPAGEVLATARLTPTLDAPAGSNVPEAITRVPVPAELVAAATAARGLLLANDGSLTNGSSRRVWAPAPDHAIPLPTASFGLDAHRDEDTLRVTVTARNLLRDAVLDPGLSLADAAVCEQARTLLPGEVAVFVVPLDRERNGVVPADPFLRTANDLSGRGRHGPAPRTAAAADPMSVRSADS